MFSPLRFPFATRTLLYGPRGTAFGLPFKDTSGPSLNILLKLMAIVSLVFAPVFLKVTPLIDQI